MESTVKGSCEAVIVGAGPAGAYLGFLLARQGIDVVIIDKQPFPRDKVCGGGLSPKAVGLLDFDVDAVVQRSIRGAVLTYGNETATIKDVTPCAGYTVLRSEFDQYLLDKARSQGARFLPATAFVDAHDDGGAVTVTTTGGELRCRSLFGADGAASVVRERIFGRHVVAHVPALEALIQLDRPALARFGDRAVFDFAGMPNGYGWIFPKRDHANVGIYSPFGGRSLRRHLERFIAQYRALSGPLRVEVRGAVTPVGNRRNQYWRGRVSLVGDAAGLAEALFGEGIYFALKSAILAARAVTEHGLDLAGRAYQQAVMRELRPELQAARYMAGLIYRFPRFAFRHLVLNERINGDFAGLISGSMGYRRCLGRTVLGFPYWAMAGKAPLASARL
jgi:geranylgeranyl reductase family protein